MHSMQSFAPSVRTVAAPTPLVCLYVTALKLPTVCVFGSAMLTVFWLGYADRVWLGNADATVFGSAMPTVFGSAMLTVFGSAMPTVLGSAMLTVFCSVMPVVWLGYADRVRSYQH